MTMIPRAEAPDSEFSAILGEQLGVGTHRTVHQVIGHPELVIKVSIHSTVANWNEYLVSSVLSARQPPILPIMGHVTSISATGQYLIMEYLEDIDRPLSGIQYPVWLNDRGKRSTYGVNQSGVTKVRDYGLLNFANVLAQETYDEVVMPDRICPDGHDKDFAALHGAQIGIDSGRRTVHELINYPNHVLKVCADSHKANRMELLVWNALYQMNAAEFADFGNVECSRSGKYLIMERLSDVPPTFSRSCPSFPWWLRDKSYWALGCNNEGQVKIRSYSDISLGDVLATPPLRAHP